jgi:hypothetical protein
MLFISFCSYNHLQRLLYRISARKFLVMGGQVNLNTVVEYDVFEGEALIIILCSLYQKQIIFAWLCL